MSRGRCSGCGLEDTSCQKVRNHVHACPEYLALFKEHPDRCLDPEDEFRAHQVWLESDEGQEVRQQARNDRHAMHQENQARRLARARERWE